MAAQQKKYTTTDIYKKMDSFNDRLTVVENWKNNIEVGKAAVDEWKRQEATDSKNSILTGLKDLMPYIALIIAGVAAIIFAYASRKP